MFGTELTRAVSLYCAAFSDSRREVVLRVKEHISVTLAKVTAFFYFLRPAISGLL
jgi:hypothetical protein